VIVPSGGEAFARVRLDRSVVLTRGDRTVLRLASPALTVGGGLVLDPEPPSGGVRRAGAFGRFEQLQELADAAVLWLREADEAGLDAAAFVRRGGLDTAASEQLACDLVARGAAAGSPAKLVERRIAERLAEEVRVALAAQQTERSADDERAAHVIEVLLRKAGLTPPDVPTLAREANLERLTLEGLLQGLVRDRRLARLGGLHFHPDALERLKAEVRALTADGTAASIDVATFKTRYGLSRKFAIPLLEWLDRERVTRRVGEKRIVI
jgi:selenocysteine-specific elongation factor